MKKFLSIFLSLLLSFVICFSVGNIVKNIGTRIIQDKQINEDVPTETQIDYFKAKTENKCFYYYDNLSNDEKSAYITMYYQLFEFDESITLDITKKNIEDVFLAVLYDNPDIFWVDLEYEYTDYDAYIEFYPKYRLTENETKDMQEELSYEIDKIMRSVSALGSDYEKELYIHDYIIEATQYDIETLNNLGDTVYSSLISGRSICEGYARAMQILLDNAGINNYLVTGNGKNDGSIEPHMWNIVNIDGNNYHLDVTWDDLNEQNDIVHFYFNVTDDYISRDHMGILPEDNNCNSTVANYFAKEKALVKSFNGYSNHITRTVDRLSNGNYTVEFYFENKSDYDMAVKYLTDDKGFFDYIVSAVEKSGRNLKADSVDYYTIADYNYLCIVFKEG